MLLKTKIQKRKNNILFWVIFFVVLFLFLWVSSSFAKFATKISGKAGVGIASPIMEVVTEQSMLITANKPENSCYFEVRNYNTQGQMNEVEMEYYIEIIGLEDKEVSFTLYEGEKEVSMKEFVSEKRKLGIRQKENHVYQLKIIYQKEEMNLKDLNQKVEIKVHSIQKI